MKKGKNINESSNISLLIISTLVILVLSLGIFMHTLEDNRNITGYSVFSNLFNKITGQSSPSLGPTDNEVSAQATTYYIDYVLGSDSNLGTSTSAPWKHAPGMAGCTLVCGSATPGAGDKIIFKGGVVWPSSALPLDMDSSFIGSSTNPIYYGVDLSWFNGTSFSRPVFDGQKKMGELMGISSSQYVTIDNIEFRNANISDGFCDSTIGVGDVNTIVFNNIYVHSWDKSASTDEGAGGAICVNELNHRGPVIVNNSKINNQDGCTNHPGFMCGGCLRAVDEIYNSELAFCTQGLLHGGRRVINNTIHDIGPSYHATAHTNSLYLSAAPVGGAGVPASQKATYTYYLIYGNTFYNIHSGSGVIYPTPSSLTPREQYYIYNNLAYNSGDTDGPPMINIDPEWGTGDIYVWFNTFSTNAAGLAAGRVTGRPANITNLVVQNNHFINTSGFSTTNANNVITNNNLFQTRAQADATGYLNSNLLKPISGSSPSVNAGVAITCVNCTDITKDLLGSVRPQGSGWDIGAYEYKDNVCINCRYINQTGGGSANGSDWKNPLPGLPATLTRGYTYYVADGIYSSYNFDDVTSGSSYIVIKKAIPSDHGTDTGWISAYGDGRAEFNGLTFSTDNYIFDGQKGSGSLNLADRDYGFYLFDDGAIITSDGSANNIAIMHTEMEGHGPDELANFYTLGYNDTSWPSNKGFYLAGSHSNWNMSSIYLHDTGNMLFQWASVSNSVVENSYFARDESTSGAHAEGIYGFGSNNVIRNNVWEDIDGTGVVMISGNNWKVYNNVMFWTGTQPAGMGNGAVADWSDSSTGSSASNNLIYSNTIINGNSAGNTGFNFIHTGSSGNVATNNLRYLSGTGNGNTGGSNNIISTSDPFVNWQARDFRLKSGASAIDAGTTLTSEYANDVIGTSRPQGSGWDAGAYEFFAGGQASTNGQCSSTLNQCLVGTSSSQTTNATHYLWGCVGTLSTASCSQAIPTSAPSITTPPSSTTGYVANTASFNVVSTGTTPLTYTWQKLVNSVWTNVGTNSNSYTTTSLTLSDSGSQFRVNISNSLGSITSNIVTLTVTAAPPIPVNGLVAYYNLDSNVIERISGNYNGSIVGNPTYVNGKINQAINLDGNDNVLIGDLDVNPMSISFWFNANQIPSAANTWASLVMKASTYGFEFNGPTLNFGVGSGSGSWSGQTFDSGFSTGTWYHIVGTYDGTNLRYYRNGVQVGNAVAATLTNSNNNLRIGLYDGTSEYFNGVIDEVRIYNRAINSSEVNSLYQYNGSFSSSNLYHPADLNTDLAVSLNEFTNYSSYFKLAKAWPFAPSPPDANYYSRAYFLLKRGLALQGAYSYNSSASCPSCFIVR